MKRHLFRALVLGVTLVSVGCACKKGCGVVTSAPPAPCCGGGPVAVPATPVVPANPAPVPPPPPATTFSSSAAPCPNCYNH